MYVHVSSNPGVIKCYERLTCLAIISGDSLPLIAERLDTNT